MNITDLWPTETPPVFSMDAVNDLLNRRRSTAYGFAEREVEKGFIKFPTSLSTPQGQEMARILMFRAIEEYVEANDASSKEHTLEELIDSVNYLWSLFFLDENVLPRPVVLTSMSTWPWMCGAATWYESVPSPGDVGRFSMALGMATDHFRNRAWMENAQDLYFNGGEPLLDAIRAATRLILMYFPDWSTFWQYFVAKDNVLQFRLRTRY